MSDSARTSLLSALSLLAAGALAGCGGDRADAGGSDDEGSGAEPMGSSSTATLRLVFAPMYSAYIPSHDCKLPVIVDGKPGSEVDFSAADPSMVDVVPSANGAMLTMKKPGATTIRAKLKSGSETGSVRLTITGFTEDEWEQGNDRYNNGMALTVPSFDGGTPMGIPMLSPDLACGNCHGETSMAGDIFGADIEHTPQQTGGYSDQELINIFTMAKKPVNVGQHTSIPAGVWQAIHKWNVSETQTRGIIAYLRSLTPRSQGMLDFSRFRPDGGVPGLPVDAGL